jgi:hypothetical protein
MREFTVFITDLKSDVFRDDTRARITAAFGVDGEVRDFYASDSESVRQHLMQRVGLTEREN